MADIKHVRATACAFKPSQSVVSEGVSLSLRQTALWRSTYGTGFNKGGFFLQVSED